MEKSRIEKLAEEFQNMDWREIKPLSDDEKTNPWKYIKDSRGFLGSNKNLFYEFDDGCLKVDVNKGVLYANGNPKILTKLNSRTS